MYKAKSILSVLIILTLVITCIMTGSFATVAKAVAIGDTIALKAYANGQFVTADSAGTIAMLANKTSVGPWEKFQLVDAGSGRFALKALSNNKYVSTGSGGNSQLMNNATTIGSSETFTIETQADGRVALKAYVNSKYVCAENSGTQPLIANRASAGIWEKFDMIVNPADGTKAGYIGVTCGFSKATMTGGPYDNQGNQIFNLPLFKSTTDEAKFWDNTIEELVTAGVDYIAPTIRGYINSSNPNANDGGDTRKLSGLVAAIQRRGANLKVSFLDDNPASLTDKKNQFKHGTGGYNPPFDMGDTTGAGEGGYQYMWDNNYRVFFQTVPDSMRFKLEDRPVIYIWGIGTYAFTNMGSSHAKNMLVYVRQRCQAEFGFNPYIIVDKSWIDNDSTVNDPAVIDAVHTWFGVTGANAGYSTYTFNGKKVGVCIPEFRFVVGSTNMAVDPNHGTTFNTLLNNTKGSGCLVTLIEGHSDWEENATMWRAKEGSYSVTHYDYSNQRLNIMRRFTNNPVLWNVRMEAEGADAYSDTTSGNVTGLYRDGNMDIDACTDTAGGWNVGNIAASEWLEWKEVPIQGSMHLRVRVASPNTGKRLRFEIDGVAQAWVNIPNTGGWQTYQTVDCGTYNISAGVHTVRIYTDTGGYNLNYWINN
jgi:hypothetical protein